MRLYEWQGKQLLAEAGIPVPSRSEKVPVIVKAQILGGRRKKQGLIIECNSSAELQAAKKKLSGHELLIEELLENNGEYYLAIRYSTRTRTPQLIIGEGGIDVEEKKNIIKKKLSLLEEPVYEELTDIPGLADLIKKAFACFKERDCKLLEINPVIRTPKGLVAADAKITIDDNALNRQKIEGPQEDLNERELAAREIDKDDYRGVAGKTFVDLPGDLAVMASGGGASLACMDALVTTGGKPANYVEYSGNPPREKIRKLTKVTLSKPGLKGCLLIGGTANFTDVLDTLTGFTEGLFDLDAMPTYPIVVRRAGPKDKEAFAMLAAFAKKHNLNIALYGEDMPLTKAVKIMVEKAYEL